MISHYGVEIANVQFALDYKPVFRISVKKSHSFTQDHHAEEKFIRKNCPVGNNGLQYFCEKVSFPGRIMFILRFNVSMRRGSSKINFLFERY